METGTRDCYCQCKTDLYLKEGNELERYKLRASRTGQQGYDLHCSHETPDLKNGKHYNRLDFDSAERQHTALLEEKSKNC